MKVAILMPVYAGVHRQTVNSLFNLLTYMNKHRADVEMIHITDTGSILPALRTSLLEEAEKQGAVFALWIDADMTFPANTLARLLGHRARFVGVNTRNRRDGASTAYYENKVPVPPGEGLEEVGQVGLGLCLMGMDVLTAIRVHATQNGHSPYPLFTFLPSDRHFIGEDVYFCRKARAAGVRILVDHDLSNKIGHFGEREWRHGDK